MDKPCGFWNFLSQEKQPLMARNTVFDCCFVSLCKVRLLTATFPITFWKTDVKATVRDGK